MTTVNEDTGRILWSPESKYYLLRLVKENIVIVSPDVSAETMIRKEEAWKIIAESFGADGMQCQLGKLKRLWKRMKDTARQNITKCNDRKKRGVKNFKAPTELDLEVADIIANRNLTKTKPKIKPKPKIVFRLTPKTMPKQENFINKYEYTSNIEDTDNQRQEHFPDLLEPMTILEELETKASTMTEDCYIPQVSIDAQTPVNRSREIQDELNLEEIKLKEMQRKHEHERMDYERELYRKKIILIELQIKKATLELDCMIKSRVN